MPTDKIIRILSPTPIMSPAILDKQLCQHNNTDGLCLVYYVVCLVLATGHAGVYQVHALTTYKGCYKPFGRSKGQNTRCCFLDKHVALFTLSYSCTMYMVRGYIYTVRADNKQKHFIYSFINLAIIYKHVKQSTGCSFGTISIRRITRTVNSLFQIPHVKYYHNLNNRCKNKPDILV